MISITVATATANIVMHRTLTGLGLMTDFVEYISGRNVIVMLLMVALAGHSRHGYTDGELHSRGDTHSARCRGTGAGGLAVPLIAVHVRLYFAIMADITPPVSSRHSQRISGRSIATGLQGAFYALRTAVLPFAFIFNPALLLIGFDSWWDAAITITASIVGILIFAAASMNWFVTRSRLWESAVLLLVCFTLLRPDWWIDRFYPRYVERPGFDSTRGGPRMSA